MAMTIPVLVWLILGIICFLLELAMPGFIIFFFGFGAIITSLICWLYPALSLNGQLFLFLSSSLVLLFAMRGFIQRTFIGSSQESEEVDTIARPGETAEVTEAILPPGEGKVQYSGTIWRAASQDEVEAGEVVTIVSQEGLVMHVKSKDSE